MISWIQKYFQHHFRTIFAIILGLMIISFVFTIGPSGLRRNEGPTFQRHFFGRNISSQEGQQHLMGDASISAGLQLGSLGGLEAEQIQSYAFQRAASLYLADQIHLPAATETEKIDFIKGLRTFMGPDGQFDANAYKNFRDSLKGNPRTTEADINRVLSDDVRAQKLQKLVAGPGYVLPNDIKLQLTRSDTSWTLSTATAEYASFSPEIKPADAELTKYFEDNALRFQIPPRIVATAVTFPANAYLGSVSATEAEIRAYYDANPARFPKPALATPKLLTPALPTPTADPALDYALVRSQVEAALKLERARSLALKAASDFVLDLFKGNLTVGPALDTFLAERKLSVQPLSPFSLDQGPIELGGSHELSEAIFGLSQERYYTDALPTPAGAAVLLRKEILPAQKPNFTDVRAKVAADFLENEKQKKFVEVGRTLHAQLEARLKAGDTLEKAVAALPATNGLKFQVKALPAFTARNRPQDLDYAILGALEHMEKGQVSDLIATPDKGIFVYVADKKIPDLSEANPQYVTTRTQLGAYTARLGSGAMLGELVEKELKRTDPTVR